MFNFLHNFQPVAILFSAGPINLHWYGLCLVAGIISALLISFYLGKLYNFSRDTIFDLSFWLILGGLAGARIYDVLLELPYYLKYPLRVFAIWQGGLAIHGAVIAGLLIVWIFARRHQLNFFKLASLFVPGLALGQAIGRWGNYFNQELFGLPTSLPWGIPIDILNRPAAYVSSAYFHPTFFYESLGCFTIFIILLALNIYRFRKDSPSQSFYILSVSLYIILYSLLRFFLEFIKVDATPTLLGLRWPQIMCLIFIFFVLALLINSYYARPEKKS